MRWNLNDLYHSATDPNIYRDLGRLRSRAQRFRKLYRGRTARLDALALRRALKEYEDIFNDAAKPAVFAHLLFSEDVRPHAAGALVQKTEEIGTEIENLLRFFELELTAFSKSTLKRLIRSHALKPWKHFLERVEIFKAHRLSEAEENILALKDTTGAASWARFFEQSSSRRQFEFSFKNKRRRITETEALVLLRDSDRAKRRAAAKSLTQGLTAALDENVFIFNARLQDKKINDRLLSYRLAEEARHLDNEMPKAAVDALVSAVSRRYPMVKDYYRMKRRALGLEKLYDYDRYAPLGQSHTRYTFDQARALVLKAFSEFSAEFSKTAEKFFLSRWIDSDPRPGKHGGAFCNFVTPDLHPYILLNFHGTPRDVAVLAHELGHGIHASLAREHGYLTSHSALTLAETASTFGEMLVFRALMHSLRDPKEKFVLLCGRIEDSFATIFRQVAMFKFERVIHGLARQKGALDPKTLNRAWRETQSEMFGSSVCLTPDYDLWWSYIDHFVHTPFYVYAYAFGELLVFSLFAKYERQGQDFLPKYLALLRAGGSESPQTLLRRLGLNVQDPAFWDKGLDMLDQMVSQARALSREI